jgi:N-acetylglutamate synthase-like GNAT family acetyltransferase
MIFAALKEAAERGELILRDYGMCRWHKRRDGVVVIREILVLPWKWRTGIGREMVAEVRARNLDSLLLAKCPAGYDTNEFWKSLGFTLAGEKGGINEWHLQPSSTATAGIAPTAEQPLPPAGCTG